VIALTESIFLLVGSNRRRPPVAAAAPLATSLTVDSTPAGASITINGQGRGNTPSTLTVEPGDYQLTLTSGATTRSLPLVVRAGVNRQHVFFAEPESKAASATPADSGRSATAASSIPATATSNAVGGYLTVSSPIDVQLFERDALMGTSKSDRIMLPVGRHVLRTVNESYGYEGSMTVQVTAGSVSRVKLEMPDGVVNVNAVPWAEVTIDGKRFGPTPLGNVSLPIGSHEIVFTHPQLGERRQTAIVTLNGTNRVSVNLNQR